VESLDIIIIGGGPGGYVAALRAAGLGAKVTLIEEDLIGGTCLNRGCIPTKALLESTRLLRRIGGASEFGITAEGVSHDTGVISSRCDSVVTLMRKGVEGLLGKKQVKVIRGRGKLKSASEVKVTMAEAGTEVLAAKTIIIATGSSWITLPGVEIDGERIITSDHALDLKEVPASMLVVGAGAVGCELAEVYSALGTEITIVEMMPQILPGEDTELARRLDAALKRKGIKILTSKKVSSIERSGDGLAVGIEGSDTIQASKVLVGIGRKPNTGGIGLEDIGVKLERGAVVTDASMRTNVPGVFAIGDVNGKYLLAHVATAEGLVAAENACGLDSKMDYEVVPRCVYTEPEFAAVGLTEAQAKEGGSEISAYKVRLGSIGRALTMGETFGLAKIVCSKDDGRILGFHALAPHASELISEISVAIKKGLTAADVAHVIHPHPTLSEIVWEAAEGAAGRPIHGD
jgi:dihydrolipoamide dehydrogenase